jgi:hypothetical protein
MLSDEVNVDQARSILWRREIHTNESSRNYIRPQTPNENSVLVEELINFRGVGIVLYTKISSNLFQPITPELLANYAISSALAEAGKTKKDGVSYLLSAKRNGITTALSDQYEQIILSKTKASSLEEAILALDKKRQNSIND